MKKKTVIGVGEVLFDIFPSGRKMGGAPVNFAFHVSQLGLEALAVSAVGKDELGDEIVSVLNEKKLGNIIQRNDLPTGTVMVELNDKGVPNFTIVQNVAWDELKPCEELVKAASDCSAICFGSLAQRSLSTRNAIRQMIDNAPEDALIIFDVNIRQHFYSKELIEASMRVSNILKINDDEYKLMAEMFALSENFEEGCNKLLEDYGLKLVILTCGPGGSWIFSPDEKSFETSPDVKVADTVGAGDAFTAAFCASLLKGENLKTAHIKASAVAAFVCSQFGAMPLLPNELK